MEPTWAVIEEVAELRRLEVFETPEECVEAFLPTLHCVQTGREHTARVFEPGAGSGAILRPLLRHGFQRENICALEIRETCRTTLEKYAADVRIGPFESTPKPSEVDLIICNPPFSLSAAWLPDLLGRLAPGGQVAMFNRLSFLAARKRAALLQRHPPRLVALSWRPVFIGGSSDPKTDYGWFCRTAGESDGIRVLNRPAQKES